MESENSDGMEQKRITWNGPDYVEFPKWIEDELRKSFPPECFMDYSKEEIKSLSAAHIKAERKARKIRQDFMKPIMDSIYEEFILIYEIEEQQEKDLLEAEETFLDEISDLNIGIDESIFNYNTNMMEIIGA